MKITVVANLVKLLEEKLQKFQRKFAKYGNGVLTYTKSAPYICKDRDSSKYLYEVVDVDIEGKYKVDDYEFVAFLDFNANLQMNLVLKAPETPDIPSKFISRCACDHCKIERARKHTVLLRNVNNGEYIQVGKACLHDYLGKDIVDYALYLSLFKDIEEYIANISNKGGNGAAHRYFEVEEVLTQAIVDTRKNGYVSKAMVDAWYEKNDPEYYGFCPFTTTASRICKMFAEIADMSGKVVIPKYEDITEEDKQQAKDIITFINEHKDDSDYVRNIYIIVNDGCVDLNNMGLVVSAIGYFFKETKTKEEKKNEEKSEFVGEIGDKIEFTSKPELVFTTETAYGRLHIYKFTENNNIIVWKTNKVLDTDVEMTLKGTVKEHNIFRGIKQTEITRAKIVA